MYQHTCACGAILSDDNVFRCEPCHKQVALALLQKQTDIAVLIAHNARATADDLVRRLTDMKRDLDREELDRLLNNIRIR